MASNFSPQSRTSSEWLVSAMALGYLFLYAPILILVVIGSMYLGIATATEAAAFGVIGALLLAAGQGSLTWATFTDSLTGALNRRAFLEAGEDVFRRSVRYRHPLSVLAIDVDHFKRINDTFGHPIGDEVLIDLVSRIGENLRETDVFGRFGGEEFVVLLSEADEQRAIEVADRLLSVIRAADRVSMEGTPVRYTISIGIASAGEGGLGLNDVIHAADRALYNAKNAGRDRYRVAT